MKQTPSVIPLFMTTLLCKNIQRECVIGKMNDKCGNLNDKDYIITNDQLFFFRFAELAKNISNNAGR